MTNLKNKLEKVTSIFRNNVISVFKGNNLDELLQELEEVLVLSDVSIEVTESILDKVRKKARRGENPKDALQDEIINILNLPSQNHFLNQDDFITLIVGVNGGGKTTTCAKLGYFLKQRGKKVLFAAADTFRAAGSIQLEEWGKRLDIPTVGGKMRADPSSVVYNSLQSYKTGEYNNLIIDTAGRVHTKVNLMKELEKIQKVIKRFYPEEPKEALMVLDATVGQNAIIQAREFLKFSGLTGIIVAKMDGTAKAGTIISIAKQFKLPVKFIGLGENIEDLKHFSPQEYGKIIFEK